MKATGAAAMAAIVAVTAAARADDDGPLWKPEWRRAEFGETAVVTTVGVAAAFGFLFQGAPRDPLWVGNGILFDGDVRGVLRASTDAGRYRAEIISNVLLVADVLAPMADILISTEAIHHDHDAAWQLLLADSEAASISAGILFFVKTITRRERPEAYAARCDENPDSTDPACAKSDRYQSFPSGHAGVAFTSAALLCTVHTRLDMHGKYGDESICATAIMAATATGLMRIVADRHYTSDVLAGAVIGGLVGWLVPLYSRFHGHLSDSPSSPPGVVPSPAPTTSTSLIFTPTLSSMRMPPGFSLSGTF